MKNPIYRRFLPDFFSACGLFFRTGSLSAVRLELRTLRRELRKNQ